MTLPLPALGKPRISGWYLQWLHEYVRERGEDPAQLPHAALAGDPQNYLLMSQWRDTLRQAAELLADPDLGLHFGQSIGPQRFGVIGYLLHHCSNLGEVLLRLWHYRMLFVEVQRVEPFWERGEARLAWSGDGEATHYQEEVFGIVACVQFARRITAQKVTPTAVGLRSASLPASGELHAFLGCPVETAQDAIWIRGPAAVAALPTAQPDPALCRLLAQQADTMLSSLADRDELTLTVRQHIVALMQDGEPTLERVAERMRVSSRSLHRHLSQRNRRFREVLDQARRQLAESYLRDSRLSLPDIALLLGYAEQSSFTHAFRRWSGTTPSDWRRQQN